MIRGFENISDVTIYGESSPIIGKIVCANISLINEVTDQKEFIRNLKLFCNERMSRFKIPVKIKVVEKEQYTDRFKKKRRL